MSMTFLFLSAKEKQEKLVRDFSEISRRKSPWRDLVRRFMRNRLGMLGFCVITILIIMVMFAPFFAQQDYAAQSLSNKFAYPSPEHIMGTDNLGRDLWSRLLYGGRISLLISLTSVTIASVFGIFLGSIAGYFGGTTDLIITRLLDVLMAIPQLLLAVSISAALGSGPFNTALAISVSAIPSTMRILRSTVLSIKSNDFVEAARATGSRHFRVIFKHILPNTLAPLIVNATLQIGGNILAISGLSFIGLGVMPPTPEWGSILNAGRTYLRDFYPIIVFPAIFIFLTVFGINLLGDGLRDALDPRLRD